MSDERVTQVAEQIALDRASEFHLAEYRQIKEEQRDRIRTRDNLTYATFTAAAAIVAFSFSGQGHPAALLLLPPVCFVLGWTYLMNDWKVSGIRRYIRGDLAGKLPEGVFGWERWHTTDIGRSRRKLIQAVADLVAFCLSGVVAVVACWVLAPSVWTVLGGVAGIFGLAVLGTEIVCHAEFDAERR